MDYQKTTNDHFFLEFSQKSLRVGWKLIADIYSRPFKTFE